MKDSKKAEVKRVLMGRTMPREDGTLAALPAGMIMPTPIGIGDGAAETWLFGLKRRVRRYVTKDKRDRVAAVAKKAMQNTGRGVTLNEQPEAVACLVRYILTRPAMLVFSFENDIPTLTAWTGRGLTGWISLRRAIRTFEESLPDTMVPDEQNISKVEKQKAKEEKQKAKEEKKKEKASKKQAKANNKRKNKESADKKDFTETEKEQEEQPTVVEEATDEETAKEEAAEEGNTIEQ